MTLTPGYSTSRIYQAVSLVCADVPGINVVVGTNVGDAGNPLVVPLSDELPDLPAILLVPGPWEIHAGNWRVDEIRMLGTIFYGRTAQGLGDGAVALMDLFDLLCAAIEAHSAAYTTESALQAVLPTTGPGLSSTEWPLDSEAYYLTWPFELQVTVNSSVRWVAA